MHKINFTKIKVFMIIKIYMMKIVECQRIMFRVDNQRYHHIINIANQISIRVKRNILRISTCRIKAQSIVTSMPNRLFKFLNLATIYLSICYGYKQNDTCHNRGSPEPKVHLFLFL